MFNRRFLLAVALTALAACSTTSKVFNQDDLGSAPVKLNTETGQLTTRTGMSLYKFDKDVEGSGKSACNGPCAVNWPPLTATAADTPGRIFTIITREDGTKQWASYGKPLYLFAKDEKPGDKNGDGVNKVWHIVTVPIQRY